MAIPSVRELVPRASFVEAVALAIRSHRLIVIQAPAGYGKTSAGALTVNAVDLPTAWYTVQPWHAGGFVEPLIAEVRTVREDFGRLTLALAAHGRPPSDDAGALRRWVTRIGASFAQELAHIPEHLVLVIEDYHVLEGDVALSDFITGAMRQPPETVTLLLIGRSTPSLPLGEWIAQGRAVLFGADDLKFSASETMALARKYGVTVDAHDAAGLNDQFEGWPAGIALQVGARTKSPTPGDSSKAPAATNLIAQHVATLPGESVEFLERVAVLELIEASILEQHGASPVARRMLREFERGGEMLTVLRSGESYRLHPLLREAMLDEVKAREGEQGIARRHAWAGEMFQAARRYAQALFHLESARDEARLVKFLNEHVGELFSDGHGEQAARAVRELVKAGIDIPVLAGRVQGMLLRERGQPGAREEFLTALQIAKQRGDSDAVFAVRVQLLWSQVETVDPAVAAEVTAFAHETESLGVMHKAHALILLGWTKVLRGDPEFTPALEAAAAAAELGAASPELRCRAALLYSYAQTGLGDFKRADAMMSELLRDLEPSEHIVLLCWALHWYARFSLVWGDVGAAEDYARQATTIGRHLNLQAELASVYSVITEIRAGMGERDECSKAAAILREHTPIAFYGPDRYRLAAHAAQMLARCAFLAGSPAEALQLAQEALNDAMPHSAAHLALRADAALYLRVLASSDAAAALATALDEALTVVPFDTVDIAKIASATAMLELVHAASGGDPSVARQIAPAMGPYRGFIASRRDLANLKRLAGMLRAIASDNAEITARVAELLAGQENLADLGFRFEAAAVAKLANDVGAQRPAVAAAIRAASAKGKKIIGAAQAPRVADLTKREEEVLQLLGQGLTNKEIAQRLNLSTRTVDTHVEHVLAKFNAASRTRAVAEAIRAGLLSARSEVEPEEAATA